MSDEDTIGAGDRQELSAAEYVLGVLAPEERRRAEFRIASEPRFAVEVAYWEARLGPLAESVPAVAPPATVWDGIEARLAASLREPTERGGIWQSLVFWRTCAIASAALAAASMAGLVYLANEPSLGPPLLAQLNAESGQASFVAAVNKGGDSLTIVPAALLAGDQQKAFELWLIPPGDKPHSLGLIDPTKPVRITVPETLLPQVNRNAVLAVSLEPPGGSPTGQPTGPVIANGKLASL
jgi:anti-sigma-K factor RskA